MPVPFRPELANYIFAQFDAIFGLEGVYTYTHHFPMESTLMFQDCFDPPEAGVNQERPPRVPCVL